ncbi:MAG: SIR2 family protein, partial [Terriglobales bacterium]
MPDDEIPLIPKVPEALREAAQLGRLVPFVGAGVSRLAGCPGWAELADGALGSLREQGVLSCAQIDLLAGLSPRVKLSIACQQDGDSCVNFDQLLHQNGWNANAMGRRVYATLSSMSKTFVTTNYDRWLDHAWPLPSALELADTRQDGPSAIQLVQRRVFFLRKDFTAANLNLPDAVF